MFLACLANSEIDGAKNIDSSSGWAITNKTDCPTLEEEWSTVVAMKNMITQKTKYGTNRSRRRM